MQEMQELHDTSLSQGDTILFPDSLRTGSVPGAAMFFFAPLPTDECGVTLGPEEYSAPFLLAVFSHVRCSIKRIQQAHVTEVPGPCCHPHAALSQGTHMVNTFS